MNFYFILEKTYYDNGKQRFCNTSNTRDIRLFFQPFKFMAKNKMLIMISIWEISKFITKFKRILQRKIRLIIT